MRRIEAFVNHSGRHSFGRSCRRCRKSFGLVKRVFTKTKWDREEAVDGLCEAARDGKLDVVEELRSSAEEAGDVSYHDLVNRRSMSWGMLSLVAAAENGHLPIVQWLVLNGARVNEKGSCGQKSGGR